VYVEKVYLFNYIPNNYYLVFLSSQFEYNNREVLRYIYFLIIDFRFFIDIRLIRCPASVFNYGFVVIRHFCILFTRVRDI